MSAANFDKSSMVNQAQHIWSMLDDMAANDPASYRKFIEKQIKEGKEEMAPPKPHMCVWTTLKSAKREKLFINFFSWKHVPAPKTSNDAVPVMGSAVHEEMDAAGKHYIASVAFNPKILQEFGRESNNPLDKDTLVKLAMDYIEELNKIKFSYDYTILSKDNLYKGHLEKLQKSFTQKTATKDKKFNEDFEELSKSFGPLADVSKGNLFDQLANIAVDDSTKTSDGSTEHVPEIKLFDSKTSKPGLIQEINTQTTDKNVQKQCALETPDYEVEKSWNDEQEELCSIKIVLPKVNSVAECELDISEDELCLFVPQKYKIKISLVDKVDDEQSKAKFIKKNHCLIITMPLITK